MVVFVNVCRSLGLDDHHHGLNQKVHTINKKMGLTPQESDGNLFVYAENLRIKRLCAALNEDQVWQMYNSAVDKKLLGNKAPDIQITAEILKKKEGLKETLFYYLIRQMELNNKLNRIYTNRLQELLQELGGGLMDEWMEVLERYPVESNPPGHCVVFCVTRDRMGGEAEIKKVYRVFHKTLGYTITIKENPTLSTIMETLATLQRPKYRIYNSLVVWTMAHGDGDEVYLADGMKIGRRDMIDKFSLLHNFRKKPKIFFMIPCHGFNHISIKQRGEVHGHSLHLMTSVYWVDD